MITDVPGLAVGHAHDAPSRTGVTVILPDKPAVASVDVRGGGPGTRETEALGLTGSVDEIHGLVFSGGSAFGLDAPTGVQTWLRERNIGFPVGDTRIPIVPGAILFDLLNGGVKNASDTPSYAELARSACDAAGVSFALGTAGAGYGAMTARLAGGIGSASLNIGGGIIVGALAAVNPVGCVTVRQDAPNVWAALLEADQEFYSDQWLDGKVSPDLEPPLKGRAESTAALQNTTLCVVATNARLTKRQCARLAIMAQTGLARALHPAHTPLDGDAVFSLATGLTEGPADASDMARLGAHAANVLARAITRGVCEAGRNDDPAWPGNLAWRNRFGVASIR